ncbi:hypothetical protein BX600DRAFT_176643 [Xylariales sp. PMI_506]|nr:hypothetical protein BX600DRAFT_176643 [Xylariales sp. PMI_506]
MGGGKLGGQVSLGIPDRLMRFMNNVGVVQVLGVQLIVNFRTIHSLPAQLQLAALPIPIAVWIGQPMSTGQMKLFRRVGMSPLPSCTNLRFTTACLLAVTRMRTHRGSLPVWSKVPLAASQATSHSMLLHAVPGGSRIALKKFGGGPRTIDHHAH